MPKPQSKKTPAPNYQPLEVKSVEEYHEPYQQKKLGRQYLEHLMCSPDLQKPQCHEERYCPDVHVFDWVNTRSKYMRWPERMQTIQQSSYPIQTANPPDVDFKTLGRIKNWGVGPMFLYHSHGMSPSAAEPSSTYYPLFDDFETEKTRPLQCSRDYSDENNLLMNCDSPVLEYHNVSNSPSVVECPSDFHSCKPHKFSDCRSCDEMHKKHTCSKPNCENEEYILKQNKPPHPYYTPN